MAQKLKYIFIISILLEICKSSTQVSFSCSKENQAAILLDTANDFITRAEGSNPKCFYDIYYFLKRRKYSSLLETATNLIPTAKNACAADAKSSDAKSSDAKTKFKVVCYVGNSDFYRKGDGKFEISHIDPFLCTHIVYFNAKLHNNQIESSHPYMDLDGPENIGGYKMFNTLKHKNPNLKTLLVVTESDTGADQFSGVAADEISRTTFVSSVVPFLKEYGFDGLLIFWLNPQEKQHFLKLLQDLKASMNPQGLLLSVYAAPGIDWIEGGYDIPAISKELDMMFLMTYPYGRDRTSVNQTYMVAPLYGSEENEDDVLTVNSTVSQWLEAGAPKEKLILGLWLHGISFTLADTTQHGIGAPITGPGPKGPLFDKAGTLLFNEVCLKISKESWISVFDWESRNYYAYKGDQWVSYEDIESINIKVDYVMENGLAGVALEIANDDFRGNCYGIKYPLLNTVAGRALTECKEKD